MLYEVRLAPQVARVLRKERDRELLRRLVSAVDSARRLDRPVAESSMKARR